MKRTLMLLSAGTIGTGALLAQSIALPQIQSQGFQQFQTLDTTQRVYVNVAAMGRAETGKPYSATVTTETSQTLVDGTHVSRTTSSVQYRDSDGRTRVESTLPGPPGSEPAKRINIRDPVAGVIYNIDAVAKTVIKRAVAVPPAGFEMARKNLVAATGGFGGRGRGGAGVPAVGTAARRQNETVEDLGMMTVNGVPARGTRTTTVIPVGAIGNDREFHSVDERWYSPDLNMLIKSVNTDPRFGTTVYEMTNISRTNPDRSLFEPPSDYKIVQDGQQEP